MPLDTFRAVLIRRPIWVVGIWAALAVTVGLTSPNLTKLAAEGQSKLLGNESESRRAAELVRRAWPDQAYESTVVLALHRPAGLTDADRQFARKVAHRFEAADHPKDVLRVLGPESRPEIASRLYSQDGTLSLVVVPLDSSHVSPSAHAAVTWLQAQTDTMRRQSPEAAGLELRWTGDAVIGRDYMGQVQASLDRAAVATVILLLIVLLLVYRSFLLAMVPLATIGISLIIARGLLAWLALAGWQISPLVELFLVAILFGTGTDFCLFLSWRFAEHFNPRNPAGVMKLTLSRSFMPLVTSAGTIIIGLLLMGTTKFKLFSTTGPSVALGLALSLLATLTLTPALLVLLARYRPRAFRGFTVPSSGLWDRLGRSVMARPLRSWALTLVVMLPLAILGLQTRFVMDLLSEMPRQTDSGQNLCLVASKFDPGMMAAADRRARVQYRPEQIGGAGVDRRREPPSLASAPADRGPFGDPTAGEPRASPSRAARVPPRRGQRGVSPARRRGQVAEQGVDRGCSQAPRCPLAPAEDGPESDKFRPQAALNPPRWARRAPVQGILSDSHGSGAGPFGRTERGVNRDAHDPGNAATLGPERVHQGL